MKIRGENVEDNKKWTNLEKEERLQEIEKEKQKKLKEYGIDDFTGKNKVWKIITYVSLSLSLILMISYSVQTVLRSEGIVTQLTNIVGTFILSIFTIFFLFTSLFADNKKGRVFVITASLLLSLYSGFNLLVGADIIHFGEKQVVLDFSGKDISEVMTWAKEEEITIHQVYENSDTIEKFKIIRQDVDAGTPLKKVDQITVTISDGPSPNEDANIPNMIGWNIDKALRYIDSNHLFRVTIDFEFHNDVKRDIIFSQNIESTVKRTEPLNLKVSLGRENEFQYVTMVNLVGLDEFHATTWLKRNRIAYNIEYGYSDDYEEGIVIKQKDKKGKVLDVTKKAQTTITLARTHDITIPDFNSMSISEIELWAVDNRLKLTLIEQYDENIKKGKVIESSRLRGDTIDVGDSIKVVISKGAVYMPKFTSAEAFRKWADEGGISYIMDYQFSTEYKSGELISSSHEENQLIKNSDTVQLIISQGGTATVPNFSGMNKSSIATACKNANLLCEYTYEANSSIEKDQIIRQSMRPGSTVPEKTTITITLSSGK